MTDIASELMAEHVEVPGMPQVVVTRGELYGFLRDRCGMNPSERGFQSLDYLSFGRRKVDLPLTEPAEAKRLLDMLAARQANW